MLWLYVILGLITLASAAGALIRGRLPESRTTAGVTVPHIAAIALVAVAWIAQHLTPIGWAAMLSAAMLEGWVRWFTPRRIEHASLSAGEAAGAAEGVSVPDPVHSAESPDAREPIDVPAASARPDLEVRCLVLLAAPSNVGADVLVAALRRGGDREAMLDRGPGGATCVRFGALRMELRPSSQPVSLRLCSAAAAQTWDWPEARSAASSHVAHVEVVTRAPAVVFPALVVRRQLQAAGALAEFARVVALCWPDAPRLMPPPVMPIPNEAEIEPVRSCIAFRDAGRSSAFADAKCHVCDSVGLNSFGLPDVEIMSDGPPGRESTTFLYDLATRIFRAGPLFQTSRLLTPEESMNWAAESARAILPPERAVLRIAPIRLDDLHVDENSGAAG